MGKGDSIERLWSIIDRLRGDNGCPWDRKQTPDSVKGYVVEEAHEVDAAIRTGNPLEVMEELGDLLFMVLFMIHLYEEEGFFRFEQVCAQIEEKMIRRHPHVFGNLRVSSAEEVKDNWEKIKRVESRHSEIPKTLPALMRAYRLLSRNLLNPPIPEDEDALKKLMKESLKRLLDDSKSDLSQSLADIFVHLCQFARMKGYRAEDLLQKHLDEMEIR
ncbi:MAG: hypothetical protein N2260_01085 [Syntrophobacterales bacterium]|nr:hypothetical protein [Syntrophobacterales bacterium]